MAADVKVQLRDRLRHVPIVLASTSPRRRDLLGLLGVPFTVVAPQYEEDVTTGEAPAELAAKLALGKAQSVAGSHDGSIVIGSDTFIAVEAELLGKPNSPDAARQMLSRLSGTVHQVHTGYALVLAGSDEAIVGTSTAQVHMAELSADEIDEYVASGEPLDKAGAYAIHQRGGALIDRMEGDFTAVVGLPLRPVRQGLLQLSERASFRIPRM